MKNIAVNNLISVIILLGVVILSGYQGRGW